MTHSILTYYDKAKTYEMYSSYYGLHNTERFGPYHHVPPLWNPNWAADSVDEKINLQELGEVWIEADTRVRGVEPSHL